MIKKMIKLVLLFILINSINSIVFAATKEEVESHFQNGFKYVKDGKTDKALSEFYKVVSSDRSGLSDEYYTETYSEAFFHIGLMQYSEKNDIEKAIENYKKALKIFPDHKRALYYLADCLLELGEVAEAKLYYDHAKLLGFTGDRPGDPMGEYFTQIHLEDRDFTVQYQSFFDPSKTIMVAIKGNPCGDDELIKDTITAIEKQSKVIGYDYISPISIKRIHQKDNNKIIIEKWTVGEKGNLKEFWIKYNFAPPVGFPSKVRVIISETDQFPVVE